MINYFFHDTFSHNDEKLEELLFSKVGLKGYGFFWLLLEFLAGSPDGKLKLDYNYLGRKCNSDASADLIKSVINDFGLFEIIEEGKYFRSKRLSQTIEDIHNVSEKRKIAGLKSGESRRKSVDYPLFNEQTSDNSLKNVKQEFNNNSTSVQQMLNKCSANDEQRKEDKIKEDKNIIPLTPQGEKVNENFERFWKAYPRKEGKQVALKAFSKVKVGIDVLLNAIEKQKQCDQWRKDNGQFIPHASTWLNQARWEDECFQSSQPKQVYQQKQTLTQQQELDVYKKFLGGE